MTRLWRRGNYVRVSLLGGIGNQLFAYTFGALTTLKNQAHLIIETSGVGEGRTNHGVSIEGFGLAGEFIDTRKKSGYFVVLAERFTLRLSSRFEWKSRLISKCYPHYQSTTVGRDISAENLASPVNVVGYFQSHRYLDELREAGLDIKLTVQHQSDWYKEQSALAGTTEFVALHIRRGDYSQDAGRYGLLDSVYYQNALNALPEEVKSMPIWVFSDTTPELLPKLQFQSMADVKFMSAPANSHPVESLLLMSKARANIIANSTFSWWGAALNVNPVAVIAPLKWYKGMEDPIELIPPRWSRIESSWEGPLGCETE